MLIWGFKKEFFLPIPRRAAMAMAPLLLSTIFLANLVGLSLQQDVGPLLMDPAEKEAFYQVLGALSFESDWRALLPDPCGINALEGLSCDVDGAGLIHFTALSFGQIQINTPPCSPNASIHSAIAKLTHLRSLTFYKCFTGAPVALSPVLQSLNASLQSLILRYNSALVGSIPPELGNLVNLERMVFVENGLEGSIPPELGGLQNLQQLVLSHSRFAGAIPAELAAMNNLIILDLTNNNLNSSIPQQIGQLSKLKKLDLSYNNLQGAIPASIGGLTSLSFLDLSNNRLNGSFPAPLLGLNSLQEIYLKNTDLAGPLPDKWKNLQNLISLDLAASKFEGEIPQGIASITSLRFLGLNSNRLTGSVPSNLSLLSNLYELDLSNNGLSGEVYFPPDFMKRLGRNLQLGNNSGLCCYGASNINPSISGLDLCQKASTSIATPADQSTHFGSGTRTAFSCTGPFQMVLFSSLPLLLLFL